MLKHILGRVIYFRYPQYIWAVRIRELVSRFIKDDKLSFLDAPSGDGVVSYWMQRTLPGKPFLLCDTDGEKIARARRYMDEGNVGFFQGDMLDLKLSGQNVWLLINSLYLIEDVDLLFARFSPSCPYIISVFPYLEHENYYSFKKKYPSFKNHHELSVDETISFFEKYGYSLVHKEDVANISFHRFSQNVVVRVISRIAFNWLDRFAARNRAAYWVAVFKRE